MSFNAKILDAGALRQVTPSALRAYAASQGWRKVEPYGDHSDVYAFGGREIILPGTARLGDYASAVSNALTTLAVVEGRDELQVYFDLSTADQDVVRVRAPRAADDGSVLVEPGVELFVHAKNLLLSAACSVTEPRRAYRVGGMKDASAYIDRVRLGQTQRGSFIVTLLSPVPPALEYSLQQSFWPAMGDEPFERKVTRQLVQGLRATRKAVESFNRGDGFEEFEKAVEHGASANLCEALATLVEQGEGADVSVTWAQTRQAPESRSSVEFPVSDAAILKEAAKVFRDREPRADELIEGFIVKLSRGASESDGRITVRAYIDEQRPVSVAVELPQVIYERAVAAHQAKLPVSIRGDLVREGQRWRLKNARDVRGLHVDEPSESASE
ncbi:MAG: hypothetical protein AB7R87_16365 [Parvibaculaceae bacterium]